MLHASTGRIDNILELHRELVELGGTWDDYAVTLRPPEIEVRTPDDVDPHEVAAIVARHLVTSG